MRTHSYKLNKGYSEAYKGQVVTWDVPSTTVAECVASGAFESEEAVVREAVNQLNIKRGHAIQAATVELVKDADGKDTTQLANPSLTIADMEKIAKSVTVKTASRARSAGGSVKEKAEKFATSQTKAKELAATASPETLAALKALGYDVPDAAPAGSKKGK